MSGFLMAGSLHEIKMRCFSKRVAAVWLHAFGGLKLKAVSYAPILFPLDYTPRFLLYMLSSTQVLFSSYIYIPFTTNFSRF